jgi:hypothetical protein
MEQLGHIQAILLVKLLITHVQNVAESFGSNLLSIALLRVLMEIVLNCGGVDAFTDWNIYWCLWVASILHSSIPSQRAMMRYFLLLACILSGSNLVFGDPEEKSCWFTFVTFFLVMLYFWR